MLFIAIFGLMLSPQKLLAANGLTCLEIFGNFDYEMEAENLNKYLEGPKGTSSHSVVRVVDHTMNRIVFVKRKDEPWASNHEAIENTLTTEGDIRLFIFLVGPKLAAKLGFMIRDIGNDEIEIYVPDADYLTAKIIEINKALERHEKEPISYLPVRAGFISIEEIFEMLASNNAGFDVSFPFADRDFTIASHEVAFHLGSILLSKKMTSRSRILTLEYQALIEIIKLHASQLGRTADDLIHQLRLERNFEMDAGLASLVAKPGFTRRDNNLKPYAELTYYDNYMKSMIQAITYLVRPTWQPYEAALLRLENMTGVDLSSIVSGDRNEFKTSSLAQVNVGKKFILNEKEQAIIREIAKDFFVRQRVKLETGEPTVWLHEFLQNLDRRIQEISDSLP